MRTFKTFSHFLKKCTIATLICVLFTSVSEAQTEYLSHVDNTGMTTYKSTDYSKKAERLNIIIVIDKSSSIRAQSNYVNVPSTKLLAEQINMRSGQLVVTPLGETSKAEMVFYRSMSDGVERPSKNRGETSKEFRKRLMHWKQSKKAGTSKDIDAFFDNPMTQRIFDYSRLEGGSDVLGGLDLAARYISEADLDLKYSKNKFIIICSDGQDNMSKYLAPESIQAEVFVVHRSGNIGVLQPYVPSQNIFTTYDAVVRHIINKLNN